MPRGTRGRRVDVRLLVLVQTVSLTRRFLVPWADAWASSVA